MGRGLFRVGIDVISRGITRTASQMRGLGQSMNQSSAQATALAGSFRTLAGAFTSLIVARRVGSGLAAMMKPAIEMQFAMKKLEIQTGRSSHELRKFQEASEAAASATTYGPQQAVEALVQLTRATGDATKASGVLKSTMGLTQLSFGGLEPKRAAKEIGQFLKSFNLVTKSAKEQQLALDKLYIASVKGGLPLEEMTKVTGMLGAAAIQGNQSMEDIITSFVIARKVIPSSRRAALQLFRVFGEIAKPKAQEAFAGLGINVQDAVTGKIIPAMELFSKLAKAYTEDAGNAKMAIQSAFGQGAVKPILAIMAKLNSGVQIQGEGVARGAAVFHKFKSAMMGAGGAIGKGLTTQMSSATGVINQMSNAWDKLLLQVGNQFLPYMIPVVRVLRDLLEWGQNFIKTMNPVVGAFLTLTLRLGVMRAGLFIIRALFFGLVRIIQVTKANVANLTLATGRNTGAVISNTVSQRTNQTVMMRGNGIRVASGTITNGHTMAINRNTAAAARNGITLASLGGALRKVGGVARGAYAMLGGIPGMILLMLPEVIKGLSWLGEVIQKNITDPMGKFIDSMDEGFGKIISMSKGMGSIQAGSTVPQDMRIAEAKRSQTESEIAMLTESGTLRHFWEWVGVSTGIYTSQTEKVYKAAEAMQIKIDKMNADKDRRFRDRMTAETKAAQMIILGTKQFDNATEKLKALFGPKPTVIKQSAINKMASVLTDIQQKGATKGVHKWRDEKGRMVGKRLGEGDEIRGRKGMVALQKVQNLLVRQNRGEKVGGALLIAQAGLGRAMRAIQTAEPGGGLDQKKIGKGLIAPFNASLEAGARKHAWQAMQEGGGRNLGTNKKVPGYMPSHGRMFATQEQARLAVPVNKPNLSKELGGSEGLDAQTPGSKWRDLLERFPVKKETSDYKPTKADRIIEKQLSVLERILNKMGATADPRDGYSTQPFGPVR